MTSRLRGGPLLPIPGSGCLDRGRLEGCGPASLEGGLMSRLSRASMRQEGNEMELERKAATIKGPSDWFTGDVFIDFLAQAHGPSPASVAHVHFTPGSRTAWHSHSVGQSLYVTEGEGRVQARGEPVAVLRPGDTVFAPGGEWHWHG